MFEIGFEKVVISSSASGNLKAVQDISKYFGAQSLIDSIYVKRGFCKIHYIY